MAIDASSSDNALPAVYALRKAVGLYGYLALLARFRNYMRERPGALARALHARKGALYDMARHVYERQVELFMRHRRAFVAAPTDARARAEPMAVDSRGFVVLPRVHVHCVRVEASLPVPDEPGAVGAEVPHVRVCGAHVSSTCAAQLGRLLPRSAPRRDCDREALLRGVAHALRGKSLEAPARGFFAAYVIPAAGAEAWRTEPDGEGGPLARKCVLLARHAAVRVRLHVSELPRALATALVELRLDTLSRGLRRRHLRQLRRKKQ